MSKIIYDASIGQWRLQTEADIKWANDVIEAVKAMRGNHA